MNLRVWWIPQIGCGATFRVPVESIKEAKKLLDILADYDAFQFDNNIKPDYCNAGGLEALDETGEWCEWYSEDGFDIDEVDENGNSLY